MTWTRARLPLVWHPLLIGLIPILSAFADNAQEGVGREVVALIALTTGLIVGAWVALALAWKDVRKSALVVSAAALLFFNFGASENVD